MPAFSSHLRDLLAQRSSEGLYRQRLVLESPQGPKVLAGRQYLNFGSNDYLSLAAHPQVPGIVMAMCEESFAVQYDRVGELLRALKVLGAHNMNRGRAEGLTTTAALQAMYRSYEQWRSQGKLSATYDVQFGMIEKQR